MTDCCGSSLVFSEPLILSVGVVGNDVEVGGLYGKELFGAFEFTKKVGRWRRDEDVKEKLSFLKWDEGTTVEADDRFLVEKGSFFFLLAALAVLKLSLSKSIFSSREFVLVFWEVFEVVREGATNDRLVVLTWECLVFEVMELGGS